jgi:hypothetical protein
MELQIITSDDSPVCLNKKANELDENEYRWGVSASLGLFSALFGAGAGRILVVII